MLKKKAVVQYTHLSDLQAKPGTNEYRIGAEFYGGTSMSRTYFVQTCDRERKHSCIWMSTACIFLPKGLTVTLFYLENNTETRARLWGNVGPEWNSRSVAWQHVDAPSYVWWTGGPHRRWVTQSKGCFTRHSAVSAWEGGPSRAPVFSGEILLACGRCWDYRAVGAWLPVK